MEACLVKELLPVPVLLSARSLLAVQAHPDDTEVGAGGTVAKLSLAGVRVASLTVTDGSMGTEDPLMSAGELAKIRREEAEKAARILGITELYWLDLPDGGTLQLAPVRDQITRYIRLFKPEALLVNDPWLPYEAHSDHRLTGLAAVEACLYSGFPLYCPGQIREEGLAPHKVNQVVLHTSAYPNTFIDVDQTWELKMNALRAHQSQFPPHMMELLSFYLTAKAREHARGRACDHVEAFKVLTPTHLHCFEDAWKC